jgi:hypothetical protein
MSVDETRELWREGQLACVMVSCCAGAELQVWNTATDAIVLRELYPTKSDLYERARDLRVAPPDSVPNPES